MEISDSVKGDVTETVQVMVTGAGVVEVEGLGSVQELFRFRCRYGYGGGGWVEDTASGQRQLLYLKTVNYLFVESLFSSNSLSIITFCSKV